MKRFLGLGISVLVLGFGYVTACSSSSTTSSGPQDAGKTSEGGGGGGDAAVINDPMNCVAPGTANNSQGIGGYCSPGGGQCTTAGPGGAPRICTADVDGTPMHAWFCTYPCSGSTDTTTCGPGAACVTATMGTGCVPMSCAFLEDAGTSGGDDSGTTDTDSGGNGGSDAGTD
jgi:hypothetical protein